MKVNMFERKIVLTKKEMTAASRYGSDAYKALQDARRDNPGYEVVIVTRTAKTQRDSYKGLTYAYMEKYIKIHDGEESDTWKEYKIRRGNPLDEKDLLPVPYTYQETREWFLKKYEAVAKFYKNVA